MNSTIEGDFSEHEKRVGQEPLRFVRVKFNDRTNSREYTYRVEPDAVVRPGQYAITRRNLSQVTISAIDVEPVPGLVLEKYDFVDPVEDDLREDDPHPNELLDQGYDPS